MTALTFGSLFAGVGGFDLGFERAGWESVWQVEWDKHAAGTLSRHWPNVERYSDVRHVTGGPVEPGMAHRQPGPGAHDTGPGAHGDTHAHGSVLRPVDCITYGFPCQDLSVAGNRAGLDGNRSGLFFDAVRIIREMREATNGTHPTWAVAENVPGLLSADNGAAMGRCLDELADAGALVIEWAVLDARWFGVPQRRRRVFIIACFDPATADRCPDPLLPVGPRGARHPHPSDTTRQDVAGTLGGGSGSRGWSPDTDRMTFVPMPRFAHGDYRIGDLASTVRCHSGDATSTDVVVSPFVKVVRSGARDDDGTLPAEVWRDETTAPTLNAFDNGGESRATVLAAYPLAMRGRDDGAQLEMGEADIYNTLRSGAGGASQANLALTPEPKCPRCGGVGRILLNDIVCPLCHGSGERLPHLRRAVRRLTPVECERLQGFPDDWTTGQADSHRYRQMGNAVCVPVAEWVARQIANVA